MGSPPGNINFYSEGAGSLAFRWPLWGTVLPFHIRGAGQRSEGTVCSSLLEQSQTLSPAQASQAQAAAPGLGPVLGAGSGSREPPAAKEGNCLLEVAGSHSWEQLLVSQPAWPYIRVLPFAHSGPQASCVRSVPHGAVSGAQCADAQEALRAGQHLGGTQYMCTNHLQAHRPLLILITAPPPSS